MPRPTEIQNIIEEALAEVFEAALPRLRAEIVRRAAHELESLAPAPGSSPTDILNAALGSIQDAGSQAEILRHLLEGEARFAGRVALFVVKGGAMDAPYVQLKGAAMLAGDFTPASFGLDGAAKDADLIVAAAREAGVDLAVIEVARDHFARALEAGHGDKDMAATDLEN